MRWSEPADKSVVEAVVGTFRDPIERSIERLGAFTYPDWVRSYHWLDASGMAIYFLHQLEILGIEGAIPVATLRRLRQNPSTTAGGPRRCWRSSPSIGAFSRQAYGTAISKASRSCPIPAPIPYCAASSTWISCSEAMT